MNSDEVISLFKKGDVVEGFEAIDSVEDKKELSSKLAEFAGALNQTKVQNLVTEAVLKKALELDEGNHLAHYNLGVLYSSPDMLELDENNVKYAIKHYLLAIKIDPDYHFARYNLALLYFFTGDKEKSAKEYIKLQEKAGDDRRFRELGMMFMEDERMRRYFYDSEV